MADTEKTEVKSNGWFDIGESAIGTLGDYFKSQGQSKSADIIIQQQKAAESENTNMIIFGVIGAVVLAVILIVMMRKK